MLLSLMRKHKGECPSLYAAPGIKNLIANGEITNPEAFLPPAYLFDFADLNYKSLYSLV